MFQQNTVVFIASSDNTYDIFRQVSRSVVKNWGDCPYHIYVGLNSARPLPSAWNVVCAPATGWKSELVTQLELIDCKNVILFLDDFLIVDRVDQKKVDSVLKVFERDTLQYVRLKPQDSSLAFALSRRLSGAARRSDIVALSKNAPYYSALQVAIWNKDHLCKLLRSCRDIWAFEHEFQFPEIHYAVFGNAVINYRHVVEKGKWQVTAAMAFRKAGLSFSSGARPRRPWTDWIRLLLGRVAFGLWGYSSLRIRKRLSKSQS